MEKKNKIKKGFAIGAVVLVLVAVVLLIIGAATQKEVFTYIGEVTLSASATISISVSLSLTFSNISFEKTITDNSVKIKTLEEQITQINLSINNGVQAGRDVILQNAKQELLNVDEIKHFEFIKMHMDPFMKRLTSSLCDIINVYTSDSLNNDGIPTKGDYEEMHQIMYFMEKPSTIFRDEKLKEAAERLRGSLVQMDWDLFRYTKQYNEDLKSHEKWSLWYLLAEHQTIFIKNYGEVTREVEKKAEEELHILQKDGRAIEYAYKNFLEIYNSMR